MAYDSNKFYFGVNIAWLDSAYGHDLGYAFTATPPLPNQQRPDPAKYTDPVNLNGFKEIVNAYFCHLKTRGVKLARMELYEGLEGMRLNKTVLQPPYRARDTFFYDVHAQPVVVGNESVDSDWRMRVETIMQTAHNCDIKVLWVLLDAALALQAAKPKWKWYPDVLKLLVTKRRSNFCHQIVEPFLQILQNQILRNQIVADDVFGIDIVNEIDWLWESNRLGCSLLPIVVTKKQAAEFADYICQSVRQVHGDLFKLTASFHHYGTLESSLRDFAFLDFYDCHRYYDPQKKSNKSEEKDHGDLPKWTDSKKCIIGEVGSQPRRLMAHDPDQRDISLEIMNQALNNDYLGVLLWRYSPVDSDSHQLLKHPKTKLSQFHQLFVKAAQQSQAQQGSPTPFAPYERAIWANPPVDKPWDCIDAFVRTMIPPDRHP